MPDPATPQDAGTVGEPRHTTVLVCDDDRLVLLTLSAALRGAGFEVIEADNGDDAILLARQHHPDIALLDIRMDGKSGLDVASYLRDYVGTPFMFLSAFSDELFIRKAREFGALDYLVKPVDIERIPAAVSDALRRAEDADRRRPLQRPGPMPAMPTVSQSPGDAARDELGAAVGAIRAGGDANAGAARHSAGAPDPGGAASASVSPGGRAGTTGTSHASATSREAGMSCDGGTGRGNGTGGESDTGRADGTAREGGTAPAMASRSTAASPHVAPLPRRRHGERDTAVDEPEPDPACTPIAIGILMERFRLTRVAAELRLAAMARQSGRAKAQVAENLVRGIDAVNAAGSLPI